MTERQTTVFPQPKPIGSHLINVALAVVALILISIGALLPISYSQKVIFCIGVGMLLLSSVLERQKFFIILETIVFVSSFLSFLPIVLVLRMAIPLLLAFLASLYFILSHQCQNKEAVFGLIGLCALALGFATSLPFFYLIGGVFVVFYTIPGCKQGNVLSWVFLFLNILFSITSFIALISWLRG